MVTVTAPALALALVLAGCAGAGRGDPTAIRPITTASTTPTTTAPTTTTSAATTTTTTTTTEVEDPQATTKQEIADTVIRARQAFLEAAANPSDPDHASLRDFYSGAKLTEVTSLVEEMAAENQAIREASPSAERTTVIAVELVSANRATAIACVDSDSIIYDISTGEVINNSVTSYLRSINLELVDHQWYVVGIETLDTYEGSLGCR